MLFDDIFRQQHAQGKYSWKSSMKKSFGRYVAHELHSYPVQYEVLRRSEKYFSSSLKCVRNRYDLSHILGFRVELC